MSDWNAYLASEAEAERQVNRQSLPYLIACIVWFVLWAGLGIPLASIHMPSAIGLVILIGMVGSMAFITVSYNRMYQVWAEHRKRMGL